MLKKGLTSEHHAELNSLNISNERYAELREQYGNDVVAQQQIDAYDGSTIYHEKFREYRDALVGNNVGEQHRLEKWFEKHYPDIGGSGQQNTRG